MSTKNVDVFSFGSVLTAVLYGRSLVVVIAVGGKPPKKPEKTSDVKKADMCAQCNMKRLPSGACPGCRQKERMARSPIARRPAPVSPTPTPSPQQEEEDAERERMKGNLRTGAPMDLSWRMLKKKTHV